MLLCYGLHPHHAFLLARADVFTIWPASYSYIMAFITCFCSGASRLVFLLCIGAPFRLRGTTLTTDARSLTPRLSLHSPFQVSITCYTSMYCTHYIITSYALVFQFGTYTGEPPNYLTCLPFTVFANFVCEHREVRSMPVLFRMCVYFYHNRILFIMFTTQFTLVPIFLLHIL